MDEKYKELETKYKKKCDRVSLLIKKNKSLEGRIESLCDRDNYAWQQVKKFQVLEEALGKFYYKVFYSCMSKAGFEKDFDQTILCCHPRIAVLELQNKGYEKFKFLSVEKLAI